MTNCHIFFTVFLPNEKANLREVSNTFIIGFDIMTLFTLFMRKMTAIFAEIHHLSLQSCLHAHHYLHGLHFWALTLSVFEHLDFDVQTLNISQKYLTSFYVFMTIPNWRAPQILSQTHFIELLFSVSKRVHFLSEVQHNSTCHLNIQFSCQFWVRPVTDVTMVKLVNFSCVDVSIVEQYFIITTIRSLNNLLDILIRENW